MDFKLVFIEVFSYIAVTIINAKNEFLFAILNRKSDVNFIILYSIS